MKYFLLFLSFILAFSPNGLCTDLDCCDAMEEVVKADKEENCETHCFSSTSQNTDAETPEDNPQHTDAHCCDCCMITLVIPNYSYEEVDEVILNSEVQTITEMLAGRYSFSIWNPPIKVA